MAHPDVMVAVAERLAEGWDDKTPILKQNEDGDAPSDGSEYVKLQFPAASRRRAALGSRVYREEGAFRVVIGVAIGEGLERASDLAEAISAIFCDRKFHGVQTFVPSSPFVGDENDDGNYFVTSVSVPYAYVFSA